VQFTCVLATFAADGNKVYCFGGGDNGQLGDGKGAASAVITTVQGLPESPAIRQLVAGPYAACVVFKAQVVSGQGV
jgi:alpha-tubulin suppressor-like RCC1 family protein